jgi:hypothetical protein
MKHIKIYEEFLPLGTDFDYWITTLNKLGYNITDKLSGGYYGFCYLTDNKKVIKVSFNRNDALAAHKLKNSKNEYLVDYYDVIRFVDKSKNIKMSYIIEMEYLDEKPHERKLETAFELFYKVRNSKLPYNLYPNSYVRDFFKIKKEANAKGVSLDLQNHGNFLIKNNHLCAIDIGVPYTGPGNTWLNYSSSEKSIPLIEF